MSDYHLCRVTLENVAFILNIILKGKNEKSISLIFLNIIRVFYNLTSTPDEHTLNT